MLLARVYVEGSQVSVIKELGVEPDYMVGVLVLVLVLVVKPESKAPTENQQSP